MKTIDEIIAVEPEVGRILREARGTRNNGENVYRLYSRYKSRLARLAGWFGGHRELQSREDYETVAQALRNALDI